MASGKGRTPAVQAPNLRDKSKEITWETNEYKMLLGQRNRADTSSAVTEPGRQMNRYAAWPAEKGGHQ